MKQYKCVLSNMEILSVTRLAIVCSSSFACTIHSPFLFCCMSNCGALQAAIMDFLAMDTDVTSIAIMFHRLNDIQAAIYNRATICHASVLSPSFIQFHTRAKQILLRYNEHRSQGMTKNFTMSPLCWELGFVISWM